MERIHFKDLTKKIFGFLLSFSSVCLFHISLAGFANVYLKIVPIETPYILIPIITFILMIFFMAWSFRILKDWSAFGSLMIVYGLLVILFPDYLLWVSHEIFGAVFIVLGNIFMLCQNSIYVFKNKRYLSALLNWKGMLFDLFLVVGLAVLGQTILTFVIPPNDVKLLSLAISNTILMTAGFSIVGRRTEYTSFIYILIISIVLSIINIPFMRLMGIPSYLISFSIVYILAAMGLGGALSISLVINKGKENHNKKVEQRAEK